jgi:tetratricopeptide (TPR) repeat protein
VFVSRTRNRAAQRPASRRANDQDQRRGQGRSVHVLERRRARPRDFELLARLPEVEALLDRALEIDEAWEEGALHELTLVLAGAARGVPDVPLVRKHYERAIELSRGRSASVHLAYAEAVSVPLQNAAEFRELIQRALDVDPEQTPERRLLNLLAHRSARWLSARADQLIVTDEPRSERTAR